jgi:hypothetical protein
MAAAALFEMPIILGEAFEKALEHIWLLGRVPEQDGERVGLVLQVEVLDLPHDPRCLALGRQEDEAAPVRLDGAAATSLKKIGELVDLSGLHADALLLNGSAPAVAEPFKALDFQRFVMKAAAPDIADAEDRRCSTHLGSRLEFDGRDRVQRRLPSRIRLIDLYFNWITHGRTHKKECSESCIILITAPRSPASLDCVHRKSA